jgi:Ankyrin repeat
MDAPARAGRDRAVITGSAGPGTGKGAVRPRSSRGSGQPVSPTGAEAVYRQLFDSFDRDRDDKVLQWAVFSRLLGRGLLPDDPRISEALARLTAVGVDPGTADYDGRTPLHLAAAEGQPEVVSYLLALGADPQPRDRWGGTPPSDAEANGHTHVADLLRQAVRDTPEAAAV